MANAVGESSERSAARKLVSASAQPINRLTRTGKCYTFAFAVYGLAYASLTQGRVRGCNVC